MFFNSRETKKQGTEIGDINLKERLSEDPYKNEYEDILREREKRKAPGESVSPGGPSVAAEETDEKGNGNEVILPDEEELLDTGISEEDLFDEPEEMPDEYLEETGKDPEGVNTETRTEALFDNEDEEVALAEETEKTKESPQLKPEGAAQETYRELFSSCCRRIKIARYNRVYFDGQAAPEKMNAVFESEEELCRFIDRISDPGKGPLRQGYFMGYRFRAVLPPSALSGATVSFAGLSDADDLTEEEITGFGIMSTEMLGFLKDRLSNGADIIIGGKNGSGTELMLGVLGAYAGTQSGLFVSIQNQDRTLKIKGRDVLSLAPSGECTEKDLIDDALEQKAEALIIGELSPENVHAVLDIAEARSVQFLTGLLMEEDKETLFVKRLSELSRLAPKKIVRKITGEPGILYIHMESDENGMKRAVKIACIGKEEKEGKTFVKLRTVFRYDGEKKDFIKEAEDADHSQCGGLS